MNLLINAAESCDGRPCVVHVSTSAAAADARTIRPAFGLPPVQPGAFVRFEVRDTGSGSGMTEEVSLAYRPFNDNRMAVRAGFGVYYALQDSNSLALEMLSPPFSYEATILNLPPNVPAGKPYSASTLIEEVQTALALSRSAHAS